MKFCITLLLGSFLLVSTASAQGKKATPHKRAVKSFRKDHPGNKYRAQPTPPPDYYSFTPPPPSDPRRYDSTYTFKTRTRFGGYGRTINESTTGVMGHDDIRMNQKGEYRNMNTNTGIALPPNTGGRP